LQSLKLRLKSTPTYSASGGVYGFIRCKSKNGESRAREEAAKVCRYWRLKYRFAGKEKTLSIGIYPQVSLKQARKAREEAKDLLSQGIDPNTKKKAQKREQIAAEQAATFEGAAREWHKDKSKTVTAGYASKLIRSLEVDILPWIGSMPIAKVTARDVLDCLKRVASRGAEETASRLKTTCSGIFCYAVVNYDLSHDPTTSIKGFLKGRKKRHYPCLTDPKEVGALLRALPKHKGTFIVHSALLLAPYVFLRIGELRQLKWEYVNLEACTITIPAERMKMGETHILPLSRQALTILKDIQPLTGGGVYVFHGLRDESKPMSEAAINKALQKLGYDTKRQHTGHGFRGTASTLLHEQGFNTDYIERQLAHKEGNEVKGSYNHARHLPERTAMMQQYADYLDGLRDGAQVVPIHKQMG